MVGSEGHFALHHAFLEGEYITSAWLFDQPGTEDQMILSVSSTNMPTYACVKEAYMAPFFPDHHELPPHLPFRVCECQGGRRQRKRAIRQQLDLLVYSHANKDHRSCGRRPV